MLKNAALRQILNGQDDQDWEATLDYWGPKTLIDGSLSSGTGVLMKRLKAGADEFRLPSAEEEEDFAQSIAW